MLDRDLLDLLHQQRDHPEHDEAPMQHIEDTYPLI